MFGGVGASKHAAGKTKEQTVTAKAKKPAHSHLAKKGETPARTTGKIKTAKRAGSPAVKPRISIPRANRPNRWPCSPLPTVEPPAWTIGWPPLSQAESHPGN